MIHQELGGEACFILPQSAGCKTWALRQAHAWLEGELTSRFGGFTRLEGEGVGQENGKNIREPVFVYLVAASDIVADDNYFFWLAETLAKMGAQETVYMRLPSGKAFLVGKEKGT